MRASLSIFFLAASLLALIGCKPVSIQESPPSTTPNYSAQAEIDGYTIHVDLTSIHPFLAEYRKVVQVTHGDKLITTKEFVDTGGFASLYFLRDGTRITIVDGVLNGFVLDVGTGDISEVNRDSIPRDFAKKSFGRFMFIDDPKRSYKWFTAENLPKWVNQ